ncbi:hypothetical protein RZS08_48570, partial [Arthrospira platensis SPKY1]|nr:hypothetical protein [Arthrospira platensis SPKY1]
APLLVWLIRHPLPQRPPGDVLTLWRGVRWSLPERQAIPRWQRLRRQIRVRSVRSFAGAESGLIRWRLGGAVLLITVLGLGLLLG